MYAYLQCCGITNRDTPNSKNSFVIEISFPPLPSLWITTFRYDWEFDRFWTFSGTKLWVTQRWWWTGIVPLKWQTDSGAESTAIFTYHDCLRERTDITRHLTFLDSSCNIAIVLRINNDFTNLLKAVLTAVGTRVFTYVDRYNARKLYRI